MVVLVTIRCMSDEVLFENHDFVQELINYSSSMCALMVSVWVWQGRGSASVNQPADRLDLT